uniref:Uncharacterized protein n=1 Tax=Anguilla anguilla TaxID=7936 RepID=A0A0E9UV06_ANGAN
MKMLNKSSYILCSKLSQQSHFQTHKFYMQSCTL